MPSGRFACEARRDVLRAQGGEAMSKTARSRSLLLGATSLALGVVALWIGSSTRTHERDARTSTLRSARSNLGNDEDVTRFVASRSRVDDTLVLDAPPARGETLRVDVVDAGGRPAVGVPIACGIVASSTPDALDELLRASSDARGSAWIELAELTAPLPRPNDRGDGSLRLRAGILAHPVPELVLDSAALDARQVVLRLPDTGSVRLELVDALGHAMPTAGRFAVWARAAGTARDVEPFPRWVAAPRGVATLEHVGLGLELRVAAAPDGDGAPAERICASGPWLPGEVRAISVPLGAQWPTVLVRARDEHGEPLRNELLGVAVEWSRPTSSPAWSTHESEPRPTRTDDEGRVRFPLRGTVAGGYTRRLVLTHPFDDGAGGGVARAAERDLSRDVALGSEVDLGDVELQPLEQEADAVVWVSGIVTDQAGGPVRTATVLVSALRPDGTSVPDAATQVTVEADGRFTVRGAQVAHRLSVRAVAPSFLRSASEDVAPGASGLRLRLRPAARWEGRLRLDVGMPTDSLAIEVITPERRRRTVPMSEHITMEDLEQEWVDVEVHTRTGNWLVARWEQLPTNPAGMPPAARVNELDLRGRLTHLRLRLTDSDGMLLDRVFAHVHPEPWPEAASWIRAGRLELVVPREARRILVRPRGYPSLAIESIDGLQEITCGPRSLDG